MQQKNAKLCAIKMKIIQTTVTLSKQALTAVDAVNLKKNPILSAATNAN